MRVISTIVLTIVFALAGTVTAGAQADSHNQEVGGTVTGQVVNSVSGKPVPWVLVIAYQEDYRTVIGATLTRRDGRFALEVPDEEFALRIVPLFPRYERGWLSCSKEVVPTPGESCTVGPGDLGKIQLDRRR